MATSIPVIDISARVKGEPHGHVVDQIRYACEEAGFMQIVGHGIDLHLLDLVYANKNDYLALPHAEKEAMVCPTGHPFRGWKERTTADGAVIQERFQACTFDDHEAAAKAGVSREYLDYFHPNIWPDLADFEPVVQQWFMATRKLGQTMMSLFGEALGIGADFFAPMLVNDVSCFAMNCYPGGVASASLDEPEVLLPAHGDSGTLTILHQRGDYEGLQVQARSGEWHLVPLINEAFVCNIGDLMMRWTNGKWASTKHRVIAPLTMGQSRTSLTTFYSPRLETVIAPLPGFGEPKYEPVTQYAWEGQYLERAYRKVNGKFERLAGAY